MLQQQRNYSTLEATSTSQHQQKRYQSAPQCRVRASNGISASSTGRNSVGQSRDVMTDSTCNRRAELAQSYYQEAKKILSKALGSDESGETMKALNFYNKSLSTIRSGLAVLRSSVGAEPPGDSTLHDLRARMEKLKEQIKCRMEELLEQEEGKGAESRPVAHHTINTASTQARATGSRDVVGVAGAGSRVDDKAAADLMFHMDKGIGLFEVDKSDQVMKFDDVDAVSVFKYRHPIPGQPPAFLQCGGFIYPLIPGKSPVLKSGEKMYMFPDLRKEDGSSTGISLENATPSQLAHLDQLLAEHALFKTTADVNKMAATACRKDDGRVGVADDNKVEPTWGTTVAGGIDKGVNWMSTKIAQGTEMAGNLVIKGASKLRERIEPEEKPADIPVSVQKGVHYTRQATGCVVRVSDFLMTSLAQLTVKAATGVKNTVQESEYVKSREVNPHAKEAWKVTKSGVKGVAGVFTDLKGGAAAVARSVGKETSRTVGHKYGEEAEHVADDAIVATGNTVNLAATYWSWKTWGITFLGKIGEVMTKENKEGADSTQAAVKSS